MLASPTIVSGSGIRNAHIGKLRLASIAISLSDQRSSSEIDSWVRLKLYFDGGVNLLPFSDS